VSARGDRRGPPPHDRPPRACPDARRLVAARTLRGFAESVAGWFGKPANLRYLPWEEWKKTVRDPGYARSTWDHIAHSDNYSIEKARRLIGYEPRYSTLEAVRECVQWLIEHKVIDVSG
jgi:nucleoside-diphosphate-sugar epimerase